MSQVRAAARVVTTGPQPTRRRGTVTAVNTGPPKTLTVTVAGTSVTLRRLDATYTVGDEVIIDTTGGDWIVLGRLA